jgi:hypothetical protein
MNVTIETNPLLIKFAKTPATSIKPQDSDTPINQAVYVMMRRLPFRKWPTILPDGLKKRG